MGGRTFPALVGGDGDRLVVRDAVRVRRAVVRVEEARAEVAEVYAYDAQAERADLRVERIGQACVACTVRGDISGGTGARAWDLRGRTYSGAWPSSRRRCCRAGPGWRVRGGERDVLYHGLTAGEMLTANCQ